MNTWFTSDTHFDHRNIIKYSNRPFKDVDHMNETLITNWNLSIAPDDEVYHLGDFCLGRPEKAQAILDRLNGHKHLIIGNHEKSSLYLNGWVWKRHYHELRINRQNIVLSHYAHRVWNRSHHGAWMLYGHSHNSLPDDPTALSIDVGVDCHNYFPISFTDVERIMRKKTWKPVDHHGQK